MSDKIQHPSDIDGLVADFNPHIAAFSDAAGTTDATVGGVVGNVPDRTGTHGALTQSSASRKPILREDANHWRYLEFDSDDDHLFLSSFALAQPCTTVFVSNPTNTNAAYVFGGDAFAVRFRTNSNTYEMHAGSTITAGDAQVDAIEVLLQGWNGGSSLLSIDNADTSGDAGETDFVQLSVNGYGSGGNNPTGGDHYRILAYDHLLTSDERDLLYAYLDDLYRGGGSGTTRQWWEAPNWAI